MAGRQRHIAYLPRLRPFDGSRYGGAYESHASGAGPGCRDRTRPRVLIGAVFGLGMAIQRGIVEPPILDWQQGIMRITAYPR
jgi:hypothetical protein